MELRRSALVERHTTSSFPQTPYLPSSTSWPARGIRLAVKTMQTRRSVCVAGISRFRTRRFHDAVVLPGGVVNGDAIRLIPEAQAFVRAANDAHKPIAVICHGGWLPVSAGIVKGHTMTSWPSLQDDIRNAGGKWVDKDMVHDGNLITSRKPDDLPVFNAELLSTLSAAAGTA
jgi:transcriptional regulator GlxA family with amidase domain